jgi:hypothetical protein
MFKIMKMLRAVVSFSYWVGFLRCAAVILQISAAAVINDVQNSILSWTFIYSSPASMSLQSAMHTAALLRRRCLQR